MQVIGIIAEYNPFHNGHLYHIKEIKKKYPNSLLIAVINGYFTQRGTISIMSKEEKVKVALNNDIDIVLELPFVFGTQAADIFAYYAVKIVNELKVDRIIFGSESNNIELLKRIVNIQENKKDYDSLVKQYLKEGLNYPTAMKKALNIEEEFASPNDLLGISYIKAINAINKRIIPETIKRTNDYHDIKGSGNIVSASNIRERLKKKEDLSPYLPKEVIPSLQKVDANYFFSLLKYKIRTEKDLSIYLDVEEGIENRILKYIKNATSLEELINSIKTKRYTYNKLNRMMIHILIGVTKKDNKKIKLDYINILGFNKKGQKYLNAIKKKIALPTKPEKNSLLYSYELTSAYLYEQITNILLNHFDEKNIPIQKEC